MASKSQRDARRARIRRQQKDARAQGRDRQRRVAEAETLMRDTFTDDNLVGWSAAYGLDVTDWEQLVRAASVGLTVLLWRNTELENVHAGDAGNSAAAEHDRRVDADLDSYTDVEDAAEGARIELVLEGIERGYGIPDDVMFRANASTAAQLRDILRQELPADITIPGSHHPAGSEALPDWVQITLDILLDPEREITLGGSYCEAAALLGDGWDVYAEDVYRKATLPIWYADVLGPRRLFWFLALSGAAYASHWYPHGVWEPAVNQLRSALAHGDLAGALHQPEEDAWRPDPADGEFWTTAGTYPAALNGRQAQWMMWRSRVRNAVTDQWEQRKLVLADRARPGFSPLLVLF